MGNLAKDEVGEMMTVLTKEELWWQNYLRELANDIADYGDVFMIGNN